MMNINIDAERKNNRQDPLCIADQRIQSRLFCGTAKYPSVDRLRAALDESGCEIVTVAIRRLDLERPERDAVLSVLDLSRYRLLPNTSGCENAEQAVRMAQLSRATGLSSWIKLEVIPNGFGLMPDPVETLEAARMLVRDGFTVLPYINADPILAHKLEAIGCATIMPLGSPIGSGRGLVERDQIEMIIERATVPVVIDAGIGAPSDAALAMEIGADAVLVQTAIARAQDPVLMAAAMRYGVGAGRMCHLAGRIPRGEAQPSSPTHDVSRLVGGRNPS